MNPIKQAYKAVDEAGKTKLIRLLTAHYNVKGIRNIVGYFMLEGLNENDLEDQKTAENILAFLKLK